MQDLFGCRFCVLKLEHSAHQPALQRETLAPEQFPFFNPQARKGGLDDLEAFGQGHSAPSPGSFDTSSLSASKFRDNIINNLKIDPITEDSLFLFLFVGERASDVIRLLSRARAGFPAKIRNLCYKAKGCFGTATSQRRLPWSFPLRSLKLK